MQGIRPSALGNRAARCAPAQHDSKHRNHFMSALLTKRTNCSLCTKHTNHGPNDAVAVPAFTPRAGASPNWGRDCCYVRVSEPLEGDVRRRPSQVCHVSSYERLHAVTSVCMQLRAVYECLRAMASAPGRIWSHLVAFSRVWSRQFFFACLGPFGRVLSYLCRHLVVIFRHFSSFLVISRPIFFFPGMAGNGRLPAPAGQGWQQFARAWFPRRARDGPNDMTLILSWHTVAAGPGLRLFMFSTIVLQY